MCQDKFFQNFIIFFPWKLSVRLLRSQTCLRVFMPRLSKGFKLFINHYIDELNLRLDRYPHRI